MKLISDLSKIDKEKLIQLCEQSLDDDMPAATNMDVNNWSSKSNTLLYNLYIKKIYNKENKAGFFILENNNRYIAASGFYPFPDNLNICILGSRTYTSKDFRGQTLQGQYILPAQFNNAIDLNYKTVVITFNEYNLWLKKCIEQLSNKKGKVIANRIPDFYRDWKTLPFPIELNYTKQWVLFKHIDDSYTDDFLSFMKDLKWKI